jgi:hypothetical protein
MSADRFDEEARRLVASLGSNIAPGSDEHRLAAALRAAHAEGAAERDRLRAELEAAREVVAASNAVIEYARHCYEQSHPADKSLWSWKYLHAALARYDARASGEGT